MNTVLENPIHAPTSIRGRFWTYEQETFFDSRYSLEEVFTFFSDASNLEHITPDNLSFKILNPMPVAMHSGAQIKYRIKLSGIPLTWGTLIEEWNPPHVFVDRQTKGPYRLWWHKHSFEVVDGQVRMHDLVCYDPGFGPLGPLINKLYIKREIAKIFAFRQRKLLEMFDAN